MQTGNRIKGDPKLEVFKPITNYQIIPALHKGSLKNQTLFIYSIVAISYDSVQQKVLSDRLKNVDGTTRAY